jgi:hypothetical protein
MKSPPLQMRDSVAYDLTDAFIQGIDLEETISEGSSHTIAGD